MARSPRFTMTVKLTGTPMELELAMVMLSAMGNNGYIKRSPPIQAAILRSDGTEEPSERMREP